MCLLFRLLDDDLAGHFGMKGTEVAERTWSAEGVGKLIVRIHGARLKALIIFVHGVRHVITVDPGHLCSCLNRQRGRRERKVFDDHLVRKMFIFKLLSILCFP